VLYVCRRANEEVHGEFSMAEDIVAKQKQWISVALSTDSDSASISKQNGKSSDFTSCVNYFVLAQSLKRLQLFCGKTIMQRLCCCIV